MPFSGFFLRHKDQMRPEISERKPAGGPKREGRWIIATTPDSGCLRFFTGREPASARDPVFIDTGQPLLDGLAREGFVLGDTVCWRNGPVEWIENQLFILGRAQVPVTPATMEEESYRLYRQILEVVGQRSLYRIWNYVPNINHEEPGLLENYKLFCVGRSRAFAENYGATDTSHFPSASATGCSSDNLTVVFLAGFAEATHWENPEQVPAYKYPQQYGPRSPAFARASRFTGRDGNEWVFIAGTAAIKGSETQSPGQFEEQLEVTFENIGIMLSQAGMDLQNPQPDRRRHFKVFLRHPQNLDRMRRELQRHLQGRDSYSIVEADICRADLEVEIELIIFPSDPQPAQ